MGMRFPNMPRSPEDEAEVDKGEDAKAQLRAYLAKKMIQDQDPQSRRMDRAPGEILGKSNQDISFLNLLNQSANQLGTLGGKTANAAPVQNYSKDLMAGNSEALSRMESQRKEAQGADDRTLKIKQYLADRQQQTEDKAAERKIRREQIDAAIKGRQDTADYRNKMLGIAANNKTEKASKDDRDFTFKLSKEYADDPTSKATATIRQQVEKARGAAKNVSPANDMALVYALMRINDPNSTVREGEFQMGTNLGSVDQKILSLRDKALSGTMDPTIRKGIIDSIEGLASAQEKSQSAIDKDFQGKAQQWKIDPAQVIGSRGSQYQKNDVPQSLPGAKAVSEMTDEELMLELEGGGP